MSCTTVSKLSLAVIRSAINRAYSEASCASSAFVCDNKSSKISFDHFQQINDATSAVIPRHVLGERLTLMQGRIGIVEILRHVNCPLDRLDSHDCVRNSLRVKETMLFPHCGFIGFNFGVDLQIGRYSCKLLGQDRSASFLLRHFSCEFLKVLGR